MGGPIFLNPKRPVIAILATDAVITRPPKDVGTRATYPCPVLYQRIPSASLERIIQKENPGLLSPILEAVRELVKRGERRAPSRFSE